MKITEYNYQIKKSRQKKLFLFVVFFISAFVLINLILSFLVYSVRQNSPSMTPDIGENSLVMMTPLTKSFERGDLVLVKSRVQNNSSLNRKIINKVVQFFTGQQFSPYENENLPGTKGQLRRIVGLPGDVIYMRDYVLYVKPKGEKFFLTEFEITPKTYNVTFFAAPSSWDSSIGVKGSFDEIELKENEYFVLGDNRKTADDSRLWGPVKKENITAKALFCYFPFSAFKFF